MAKFFQSLGNLQEMPQVGSDHDCLIIITSLSGEDSSEAHWCPAVPPRLFWALGTTFLSLLVTPGGHVTRFGQDSGKQYQGYLSEKPKQESPVTLVIRYW